MTKDDLLDHARECILPYWLNAFDEEHGGFSSFLDETGNARDDVEQSKGLIQHARLMWSYAYAYDHFSDIRCKELAFEAFDFITQKFWDDDHQGFYFILNAQGRVIDDRKDTYAHSFALYGLSQLYKVSRDERVLNWADKLFQILTEKGRDLRYGGYHRCFDAQWVVIDQGNGYGEPGKEKYLNTHLHLLEAVTLYCEISASIEAKKELEHLVDLIVDKVYDPVDKTLCLFFTPDWVQLEPRFTFGHDIETSWLLVEAIRENRYREPEVLTVCDELIQQVYRRGLLEKSHVPFQWHHKRNTMDRTLYWWVQAESLVGFAYAGQRLENLAYWQVSENIWKFCLENFWDRNSYEWFEQANGKDLPKSGHWKDPYHTLRALVETSLLLESRVT